MSLKSVEMWTVVCDECGADAFEGNEFTAWADRDSALLDFEESCDDWSTDPTGKLHRCPEHNPFCTRCGKDAGELSGERDYMCRSCFRGGVGMREARVCTAPDHVGERSVLHISELFEIRLEARRMTADQGREKVKTFYRACRVCTDRLFLTETVETGTLL